MNVSKELKKYGLFASHRWLVALVKRPKKLCPEPISAILPSFKMAEDGPVLAALFLVTQNYLCEIRVARREEEFDYVALSTICNYRVQLGEHVLNDAEGHELRYKSASIGFHHNLGAPFSSQLEYVGQDADPWINAVTKAIPVSLLRSQG